MLSERYTYDGRPTKEMNALQLAMKAQVEAKVEDGRYPFETVRCCICDRDDFETLATKDRYGLYMPVVVCKTCGLVQTNPRMSQEAYTRFYNDEYRRLYGGTQGPSEEFFLNQYGRARPIYDFLRRSGVQLAKRPEPYVLEVGCAAGGILHYFREQGCRVKGIDLDQEYLEYGKTRYGLDLLAGTLSDLTADVRPDVVIYSHVLEHLLKLPEELSLISRMLAEGGVVYIEVPGIKWVHKTSEIDFLRYLQNAHTYHFTLTTLRNLLETNGFEMVVGDEFVRSVFRKSRSTRHKAVPVSDYPAVVRYLRRVEFVRSALPAPPGRIKYLVRTFPRRAAGKLLTLVGLYEPARRLYRRVRGS